MNTTVIVISCIINFTTDLDKEIYFLEKAILVKNRIELKQLTTYLNDKITFFVAKISNKFHNYFFKNIIVTPGSRRL